MIKRLVYFLNFYFYLESLLLNTLLKNKVICIISILFYISKSLWDFYALSLHRSPTDVIVINP